MLCGQKQPAAEERAKFYNGIVPGLLPPFDMGGGSCFLHITGPGAVTGTQVGDNLYADDACWVTLSSNVGFSIEEGTFLPHGRSL